MASGLRQPRARWGQAALGLVTLALLSSSPAQAGGLASTVTATVVSPANLSSQSDLSFGAMRSRSTPGLVTLSESGVRKAAGGVALLNGETATAATLSIASAGDASYALDVPDEVAVGPMTIRTRLHEAQLERARIIKVTAEVKVPANTPPAAYRGVFPVTAVFN